MLNKYRFSIVFMFCLLCTACGSNDDKSASDLSISLGDDIAVNELTPVKLSLESSSQSSDIVDYQWRQLSGSNIELTTNSASLSFISPKLIVSETLVFELSVTDRNGNMASDSIAVEVLPVNESPEVNISFSDPIKEQEQVELISSAIDLDGEVVSYEWKQISGTTVQIDDKSKQRVSFTTPDLVENEILTFELTVRDNEGAETSEVIDVLVLAIQMYRFDVNSNREVNVVVNHRGVFELLGTYSSEATYIWSQLSGAQVFKGEVNEANISFLTPKLDRLEKISLKLVVTEGDGSVYQHIFIVTVQPYIADIKLQDGALASCIAKKATELNAKTLPQLTEIDSCDSIVSNITGLESFIYLEKLDLAVDPSITDKAKISDITSLSSLVKLHTLNISGHAIDEIADLSKGIAYLNLNDNNISDTTKLFGGWNYKQIHLRNNKLKRNLDGFKYRINESGDRLFYNNVDVIDLTGNDEMSCKELNELSLGMPDTIIYRPSQCDPIDITVSIGTLTGEVIKNIPYATNVSTFTDAISVSEAATIEVLSYDKVERVMQLQTNNWLRITTESDKTYEYKLSVKPLLAEIKVNAISPVSIYETLATERDTLYFDVVANSQYSITLMRTDYFGVTASLLDTDFNFISEIISRPYAGGACNGPEYCGSQYQFIAEKSGRMYVLAHGDGELGFADIWITTP